MPHPRPSDASFAFREDVGSTGARGRLGAAHVGTAARIVRSPARRRSVKRIRPARASAERSKAPSIECRLRNRALRRMKVPPTSLRSSTEARRYCPRRHTCRQPAVATLFDERGRQLGIVGKKTDRGRPTQRDRVRQTFADHITLSGLGSCAARASPAGCAFRTRCAGQGTWQATSP